MFCVDRMAHEKGAQEHYHVKQGLRGSHRAHRESTGIQETLNNCPDIGKQNQ